MKQQIPFYDTAACSAMQRSPCVLWTVHLLGHIALNNLSKFGGPNGITGGVTLGWSGQISSTICFLKQLSLFPGSIRFSPPSNSWRGFFLLNSKYPWKRFYGSWALYTPWLHSSCLWSNDVFFICHTDFHTLRLLLNYMLLVENWEDGSLLEISVRYSPTGREVTLWSFGRHWFI